jgi:hypothetical protein
MLACVLACFAMVPADAVGSEIPLFDAHVHYSENQHAEISPAHAVRLLDQAGVRMALVSSTSDEGTLRLLRAAPDRIVAELRPYRNRQDMSTWHGDRSIISYLEERLRLGVHKGIGEFHLSGEDAKSPVVGEVVRIAVERNLVLHAHSDSAAVRHLFEHDARARVLWAHLGFREAAEVEAMLARYPRLWVETSIRSDISSGGQLEPGWRQLFLRHPDRILVGTDTYIVSRWHEMPRILEEVRAWLRTLPAPMAEKIAWRNAVALYGLDAAPFAPAGPPRR